LNFYLISNTPIHLPLGVISHRDWKTCSQIVLHLCRVVLECCDLSLKLFIEPPQCLMLTNVILAVESHMLLIVICLGLLFLCLRFHFREHLIKLIFMPLSWLDTGDYSLRQGEASVFGGMWLIIGWWKGRGPKDSDGLSFRCFAIDSSLS